MARTRSIKEIELTSGGGTKSIDIRFPYEGYYIYTSGSVTLTSSWTIDHTGNPGKGDEVKIRYRGEIDPNGNSVTFLGFTMDDSMLDKNFDITAYYNGSAWELNTFIDFEEDGTVKERSIQDSAVTTSKINDQAVALDKLVDLNRGSVITYNGTSNVEIDNSTSGNILIGDGSDIVSKAVSGDLTLDSSGNATIPSNTVSKSQLDFTLQSYQTATLTLSKSQITSIGTTPITAISAPGTNKSIDVVSAQAKNIFDNSALTAGAGVTLDMEINTNAVGSWSNGFIEATADEVEEADLSGNTTIDENTDLVITTSDSSDPGGGDTNTEIKINIVYRIISW